MSQKVVLRRKKSLAHLEMATVFYCVNNELTHTRNLPPYMDHFLSHLRHFPIPPVKMNLPSSEVVEDGYLAAKRQLFTCLPFLRECKTNWCAAWEGEIWQNWQLWTFFSSHDAASRGNGEVSWWELFSIPDQQRRCGLLGRELTYRIWFWKLSLMTPCWKLTHHLWSCKKLWHSEIKWFNHQFVT